MWLEIGKPRWTQIYLYLAKMANFHPILVLQGSFPTFLRLPSPIPASVCAYRSRGGHKRDEKDAASNFEVKSVSLWDFFSISGTSLFITSHFFWGFIGFNTFYLKLRGSLPSLPGWMLEIICEALPGLAREGCWKLSDLSEKQRKFGNLDFLRSLNNEKG